MFLFERSGTNLNIAINNSQILTNSGTVRDCTTTTAFEIGRYNWDNTQHLNGSIAAARLYNRVLTKTEKNQLWHEFNRKLGGGSDFGAVIPAPTAHLEAVGEDTFYDVALATKATRTAGTVANDDFGISRAIAGPNQSWTSVTGDSFVYWNNSGWKLEKNNAAVTATGINTANTVRAVLYYPAGTVTAAQQTYLENCLKSGRYPYAFRRSIPAWITDRATFAWYGESSGSTLYPAKGSNGTLVNTPTVVRSQQYKGLNFAQASSQYANITLPYRTKDDAYTLFVKHIPTSVNTYYGLMSKRSGTGVDTKYHGYSVNQWNDGTLVGSYTGANGNQSGIKTTAVLTAGKEYVIAYRKTTSTAASGQSIFINGSKASTSVYSDNLTVSCGDSSNAYLGYFGGNPTGNHKNFAALMFSEALTDQEIQAISQALY